jgi:isopenicillin-N N-acyltransferase like protein
MSSLLETATMPVVTCFGEPRRRGRIHGEELRDTIAAGTGRWLEALGSRHGIDPDDYLRGFLDDTDHLPAIRRWTPDLLEEVRGIAEGADQPFLRILAYNLMDEEWSYGQGRRHRAPGCTVACFRTGRGTTVIAQNMDIPTVHDGTQAVLRLQPEGAPEILAFTMAGFVGLMGANAAGVGVVVNNLDMLPSSAAGLPVAFVVRGILACSTLAAAAEFVVQVPHAIGQHYGIGGPEGLASYECAGNGAFRDDTATERIVHTNHPVVNLVVEDETEADRRYTASNTRARFDAVASCAAELTDLEGVERVLSETTAPVSRAPRRGFMTFGSMAAELTVPPRVRFAPGPPHATPYVEVGFSA